MLMDAARLPSKCPHWYLVMQRVALNAGAGKTDTGPFSRKPSNLSRTTAYYQQFEIALLPKWMGEPGDVEAFAEESYRRIGGKKGVSICFRNCLEINCQRFFPRRISWGKIQEGFAALEEFYGLTRSKSIALPRLAVRYNDKPVAAQAFRRIGTNWDSSVWGSRARFESHRSWAGLPASPPPEKLAEPARVNAPYPSARVYEMLQLAAKAGNERRWNDSNQLARQAIEAARPLVGAAEEIRKGYMILAGNQVTRATSLKRSRSWIKRFRSWLTGKVPIQSS